MNNVLEITKEEIAHRNAIAYLKGQIVGYATREGMKYETRKTFSPEFQKGLESVPRYAGEEWVTERHMAHNMLRHDRPHTSDDYYSFAVTKDIKELTGFSPSELEVVKNG